MALFIGLSKGIKSYGKVACILSILPIIGFTVFCTKIVGLIPAQDFHRWFYDSQWQDFTGSLKVSKAQTYFFSRFHKIVFFSDFSTFTVRNNCKYDAISALAIVSCSTMFNIETRLVAIAEALL
jgi:hypothetical protein